MTRTGKIARLPKPIREQINGRLENGELAKTILEWLNQLPEVQKLIAEQFGGHPIRQQNLSQWRNGGYIDWQRHQLLREQTHWTAEQAAELGLDTTGKSISIAEDIATVMSAELAIHVQCMGEIKNQKQRFRQFRHLSLELSRLRRDDQRALRTQLRYPGRLHLDPQHSNAPAIPPVSPNPKSETVEPPGAGGASSLSAVLSAIAFATAEALREGGTPASRALPETNAQEIDETATLDPRPLDLFPNSSVSSIALATEETPKPLNSQTPSEERQRTGALQDAPRHPDASPQRASIPDCGSPLPLSTENTIEPEPPASSPAKNQPPALSQSSTLDPRPSAFPPPHSPIPTKTHHEIFTAPIRARRLRWLEG